MPADDSNAKPAHISATGARSVAIGHATNPTIYTGDIHVHLPPQSLTRLHQLPFPPADFTGRSDELEELKALAGQQQGAVISGLQGMGGIGKTWLAIMVAHAWKARYPDAQLFIDLRGASATPLTTERIMARVIGAWHPDAKLPDDPAELASNYRDVLHDKRALLVLDNARDAAQVAPLLPLPAACGVIITSRQHRFVLSGIKIKTKKLGVLEPEGACELLRTIAPRIGDHAPALAEACDHLPLALRLAGAALATRTDLSPADYLARLSKARLAQLDQAAPATDCGEITASLRLSYDLLDPAQQTRWRLLGVFPGSFGLVGAAAVWGLDDPEAAGDQLAALRDASLVQWSEKTRRYVLHDLLRDFARALLAAPEERDAAELRFAAHYCNLLTAADDFFLKGHENVATGLALFDLERVNIEAGQALAASQMGNHEDFTRLAARYPGVGIHLLSLRLHRRKHIVWMEAGLRACRQLADRQGEGAALGNLGNANFNLGEVQKAIGFHEQHLAIAREIGDRQGEGAALGNLGIAYRNLGEVPKAIGFFEQVFVIAREIGDRQGEGNTLGNLGSAYLTLGEMQKAIDYYEQSRTIAREIGNRRDEGNVLGNLGIAYSRLGMVPKAIDSYEKRLAIAREIGDRQGEGNALGNLGIAYKNLGMVQKAIGCYEQQLVITRELGDRRGEGSALWNSAVGFKLLGDQAEAIERAAAALGLFEAIENPNAAIIRAELARWRAEL